MPKTWRLPPSFLFGHTETLNLHEMGPDQAIGEAPGSNDRSKAQDEHKKMWARGILPRPSLVGTAVDHGELSCMKMEMAGIASFSGIEDPIF